MYCMTTTQISKATLKRFHELKDDAEYDNMEEFLDDVLTFLDENLEDFMDEYAPTHTKETTKTTGRTKNKENV